MSIKSCALILAIAVCVPIATETPQQPAQRYRKHIAQDRRIDRHALVTRHNPTLRRADLLSPLSLGNGEFAFTADITGLQTFPRFYDRDDNAQSGRGATPLVTQSQWGWHSY